MRVVRSVGFHKRERSSLSLLAIRLDDADTESMPLNSKQKGSRMEREASKALRDIVGCSASRSVQYAGTAGDADLRTSLDGVHFECKARASLSALRYFDQARTDAAKTGSIPVVLLRENGDTNWYALVRLGDLPSLSRKVLEAKVPL